MGRKNILKPYNMLDNVDISSSQTSDYTITENLDVATINIDWTGSSPVGVITIESSNSNDDELKKSEETWVTLDFGSTINVSGASGSHQLVFTTLPFRAFRIKYTRSSGSGNLTARLHAKTIGA